MLLCALYGCPPYSVVFRPDTPLALKNLTITHQGPDGVDVNDVVDFSVSAPHWSYPNGYIHVRLTFGRERSLPIRVRTPELYIADDLRGRFGLYALQYDPGGGVGSVSAYHGVTGENEILDRYVLDPSVTYLHLIFRADSEHFPERLILHLEGIEAGGQELSFVYSYRVDCASLRKEWRWIHSRFKSAGPFDLCR